MLKSIAPELTPDTLWALAAMGHGDVLAVVDANYPAHGLHSRVLSLSGIDVPTAIRAIIRLYPIDSFEEPAVRAMTPDGDPGAQIESHGAVRSILAQNEERSVDVAPVERSLFYEQAKSAFAVVQTGDVTAYACFLLTKGVVGAP